MSWHNSIRCLLLKYILKNNLLIKDFATQQVTLHYNTESSPMLQKKTTLGDKQQGTGESRQKEMEVICQGPSKRNKENETK